MKIFQEKQFINRWWLLMFILAVIVVIVGSAYYATKDASEETAIAISLISLGITLPIVLGLLYLRLETRIDHTGITTYFKPFTFTRKNFSWQEIRECYLRKFDSQEEFGGWGIRGIGRDKKAYFIEGNTGIQIITKDNHHFLIGTQRPAAAKEIIKTHFFQNTATTTHEK